MYLFQLQEEYEAPISVFGEDPETVLKVLLEECGIIYSGCYSFIRYDIPKEGTFIPKQSLGTNMRKEPNPGPLLEMFQNSEVIEWEEVKNTAITAQVTPRININPID